MEPQSASGLVADLDEVVDSANLSVFFADELNCSIPAADGASMRNPFLLAVSTTFLVGAGVTWLNSHRAGEAWEEMLAKGEALEVMMTERDTRRPVLVEPALEGLANEEYLRARAALDESAHDDWVAWYSAFDAEDECQVELRNALLDRHEETLEALHLGARRMDGRVEPEWSLGYNSKSVGLMESRTLTNLVVLEAHRHLDEGRPREAVNSLLTGLQLGRDLAHSPSLIDSMIGGALMAIACKEALGNHGLLERLPATELAPLAAGLGTIDEGFRGSELAIEGDLLLFINTMKESGTSASSLELEQLSAWRYGFSTRLMIADYVDETLGLASDFEQLDDSFWPTRESELLALEQRMKASSNPVFLVSKPIIPSVDKGKVGIRTSLRLARMAVAYRMTGELVDLADPFGGDFRVETVDESLWIKSAGPGGQFSDRHSMIELSRIGS